MTRSPISALLRSISVMFLLSLRPLHVLAFSIAGTKTLTPHSAAPKQFPTHIKQHENDETLRQLQKKHKQIAASFEPSSFNPHPILRNPHVQSIFGVFLRKSPDCAYIVESGIGGVAKVLRAISEINPFGRPSEHICIFWDERSRITTNCNRDFFTADIKYAGIKKVTYQSHCSKGLVIMVHGLESNSNSSISTDMGAAYTEEGYDVVCLNFRGCCGSPNDTLGGYHLGFTDDLRHFLQLLKQSWEDGKFEQRPIYVSGFSLGANVVVKCLGELGSKAFTDYNIHGASVTGAPFDAERSIKRLDMPGFNRSLYSRKFLETLKKRAQFQFNRHFNGDPLVSSFDFSRAMGAKSIAEFEDAFTKKIYEFGDDYYCKNSCYHFLKAVSVPLFILNAGDDPFFDPNFFPIEESVDGGADVPIKMERTRHGGHLGFMFHQLTEEERQVERKSSWMPTELARFINHVHECNRISCMSNLS